MVPALPLSHQTQPASDLLRCPRPLQIKHAPGREYAVSPDESCMSAAPATLRACVRGHRNRAAREQRVPAMLAPHHRPVPADQLADRPVPHYLPDPRPQSGQAPETTTLSAPCINTSLLRRYDADVCWDNVTAESFVAMLKTDPTPDESGRCERKQHARLVLGSRPASTGNAAMPTSVSSLQPSSRTDTLTRR